LQVNYNTFISKSLLFFEFIVLFFCFALLEKYFAKMVKNETTSIKIQNKKTLSVFTERALILEAELD